MCGQLGRVGYRCEVCKYEIPDEPRVKAPVRVSCERCGHLRPAGVLCPKCKT